jgi:hypothetical protein
MNRVSELFFNLKGWRAWAPDRETLDAWQGWAGRSVASTANSEAWPEPAVIPMMLRRRAGNLGQRAIATALSCGAAEDRYIFASRHGEMTRTVGVLGELAENAALSPTEFSMSVHHALAGLLSIHTGNRQGHTAVAAGADTFACGLLDALTIIATDPGASVLLVFYDAPLPDAYGEIETPGDLAAPLVLALRLASPEADAPVYAFSTAPAETNGAGRLVATDAAPLDFLRFLLGNTATARSAGTRNDWQWRRVA